MTEEKPRRPGRPRLPKGRRKVSVCVSLNPAQLAYAYTLGNRNISKGVRIALEAYMKENQAKI